MFWNGPHAAEVVWLPLAAAAVVYVVVALHLADRTLALRSFERPERWLSLAVGWPVWVVVAALTCVARGRQVRGLVEGERWSR